jgi:hypothetical protein
MTFVVVSVLRKFRHVVAGIGRARARQTLTGRGCVYFIFRSRADRRRVDVAFTDVDGSLLLARHYFDTEPAARAWVARDIASRRPEGQEQ